MNTPDANPRDNEPLASMQARLDFAKRLQALTNVIHGTDNIAQIMIDVAPAICDLFECDRLTLYVVNKERGELISKVKTGIDLNKEIVLPINKQSIAGYVAMTRDTVQIDDLDDPEELKRIDPELQWRKSVDQVTGYHSKHMLAAPLLRGLSREVVGVVQLINRRTGGAFAAAADEALDQLCAVLAQALFQRAKTSALLPQQYEALADQGVISAPELDLAQRWAQRKGKDIEQVLVEDFQLPLAALGKALAQAAGAPYEPLEAHWRPEAVLTSKLDRNICRQYQWLPQRREGNLVVVVTTDPKSRVNVDNLRRAFPYNELSVRYITRLEFERMFAQIFGDVAT